MKFRKDGFMIKTLRNPRYFNAIYQLLLLLVVAQQIYYPQNYKYVHLALVFIRMVLSEVYVIEFRYLKHEQYFVMAIVVTSIVSIMEGIFSIPLGFLYLISLGVAVVIMSTFIKTMIDDAKNKAAAKKFHPKHIEMLKKNRTFTNGILYVLLGINALILLYALYELIKLLS